MKSFFRILGKSTAVFFAVLFVVTALLSIVLVTLGNRLVNPDLYKRAVQNQPVYESLPGIIGEARARGARLIVVLSHLGLDADRKTAAEYSFFAAVPALAAATLYDLAKSRDLLTLQDFTFFAVGFAVSFGAAWLAVAGFLRLLQHSSLRPFAWYRILIAPIIYYFLRS